MGFFIKEYFQVSVPRAMMFCFWLKINKWITGRRKTCWYCFTWLIAESDFDQRSINRFGWDTKAWRWDYSGSTVCAWVFIMKQTFNVILFPPRRVWRETAFCFGPGVGQIFLWDSTYFTGYFISSAGKSFCELGLPCLEKLQHLDEVWIWNIKCVPQGQRLHISNTD